MVKKIRIWKVIVLSLVTFGIYPFVWVVRRRNEMVTRGKFSIPHWLWLLLPWLFLIVTVVPFIFLAYGTTKSHEQMLYLGVGYILLASIFCYAITVWWFYKFGKAVERVVDGKITAGWILAYWIMTGPILLIPLQHQFNRVKQKFGAKSIPKHKPSRKFIIWSIVVFVFFGVVSAIATVQSYNDPEWGQEISEAAKLDTKSEMIDELSRQHTTCVDKLDQDYPQEIIPDEEFAQYKSEYDKCEAIRTKLNSTIDSYNAAYEKW